MSNIILIGGPDSGKTNFLARLVAHLRDGKGELKASRLPDDIQYIENALAYLMKGEFAPRSHNSTDETSGEVAIDVSFEGNTDIATISLPDVAGETWDDVAKSAEISEQWLERIESSSGALLFVRVLSELNLKPMDWVNAPDLLALTGAPTDFELPTQVMLCEFLRLLEERLSRANGQKPRVAVILSAYDRLDPATQARGPMAFLLNEYPLFAGKIACCLKADIAVFGASIVGGELAEATFKKAYLKGDIVTSGFIVDTTVDPVAKIGDFTRPLAWVLNPKSAD